MKNFFSILMIICLIAGVFLVSSSQEEKNKINKEVYNALEKKDNVRIIINLKEPQKEKGFFIKTQKTDSEINLEKQEIKKTLENEIGEENIKHVFEKSIAVEISKKELEELKNNDNIDSIIIDKPVYAFLQDSVPLINASTVWPIQISNTNITGIDETICIIDTGIDFSHPDLIGKNKTCNIDCIDKSCIENCSISDDNGHGTHLAGIVSANGVINGVAIGSNLIGVKSLDSNGGGYDTDIWAGIGWCIDHSEDYNISVISMSLGTACYNSSGSWTGLCYSEYCDEFDSLTEVINMAVAKNISVIAATGNNGSSTHISAPACIKNVTAIGSVKKDDLTIEYNRNNLTDLISPGSSIRSTKSLCITNYCSCSGDYMTCSGTSMATPHAAASFALIRQFFRLQNNRIPTPSEIKTILNDNGKQIYDSASGYNFSRIDIYSALISLDSNIPFVNLISPPNNTAYLTRNINFSCSASDVQLSNLTLHIWNSTGIYNTITKNLTGINNNSLFNITNLSIGDYSWNCLAYDKQGNFSFADSNNTFKIEEIGEITTNLNYPQNNLFTNKNQTFNCSAETDSLTNLENITFYLWNSSLNLIYNFTNNISGISNSSIFQYNFSEQDNYSWNCLTYNNDSISDFADENYTLIYDTTKPNITLINPFNSALYSSNSQQINFSYNILENYNILNCSLIINNIINLTDSLINQSQTQNFTQIFSPGNYSWNINCIDFAENQENSNQRNFTITALVIPPEDPQQTPSPDSSGDESSGGSGGGGGGGGGGGSSSSTSNTIYNPSTNANKTNQTTQQTSLNYTKEQIGEEKEITQEQVKQNINPNTRLTKTEFIFYGSAIMFIMITIFLLFRNLKKNETTKTKP